ncbi:MAG: pyridoxal phosphate-dependent aminotransferase [Synergistaceae bacterium]|jgi:aspartate aminotransferase|nr:pyridoxal phosphate-dependent aminotransferase [Synergistaceae bacterium]
MKFSDRIMSIKPSATIGISGLANKMKAQGHPVISFSAGEPDFDSPSGAVSFAIDAIKRGETHYTLNQGILELRQEVCGYYKRRFGLSYSPDEVIVTPGAKPLIYEAIMALVNPGDEVLLISPAWVSYVEQIRLAGGVEAIVDTLDTAFVPTKGAIDAAITDRTVGMIINSPCNPTGVIFGESALEVIADAARRRGLWIIFDEIYERFAYPPAKHVNILNVAPDLRESTILVNGFSKAFAMTGWRVGYALAPKDVISKLNALQSQLTSNAASISQWAALGAMKNDDADRMRDAFGERLKVMTDMIGSMPHVKVRRHDREGAFYIFLDIRDCPVPDDVKFCERLLEESLVAAVPGSAFLCPGFVRFSYSCSMNDIREGMERLKNFLESL